MPDSEFNSYTQLPEINYTIISNTLIRSPNLSCKAYKLLSIGLSHSGKWKFDLDQIKTCFKEGGHTVDSAMKELRELGYLHLVSQKQKNGKFGGHRWFWFREPVSYDDFQIFLGKGGFPELRENGDSEDQGCLRRPITKKTKLLKKNNNSLAAAVVVFSDFDRLKISKAAKLKLSSQMDEAKAKKLVERVLSWDNRVSDLKACNTILGMWDEWKDNISKEQYEAENRQFIEEVRHLDGMPIGSYKFQVESKSIRFKHSQTDGKKDVLFFMDDRRFIEKVKNLIGECRNSL